MRIAISIIVVALSSAVLSYAQSAEEIVQRAFEADEYNQKLAERYAYREHVEERRLDKNDEVKRSKSTTYDVAHLCGRNYQRVIARDGRPVSAKEKRKEQEKLDRCIEKLNRETPDQRRKRLAKEDEEREDQHKLRREVLNAFDFSIEGDDTIAGAATWRIRADPRPGYEPDFKKAGFLTKLAGTIWIAKSDYGWVQTEVDTIAPAKFGLFLLTLKEGAHMEFTQTRVNDELWMMDQLRIRFDARVLIKGLRLDVLINWSDFKKFTSESKLIVE